MHVDSLAETDISLRLGKIAEPTPFAGTRCLIIRDNRTGEEYALDLSPVASDRRGLEAAVRA